ncbi:hypothetical protein ADUPG1_006472, partial [Aduncisulcus paluster]
MRSRNKREERGSSRKLWERGTDDSLNEQQKRILILEKWAYEDKQLKRPHRTGSAEVGGHVGLFTLIQTLTRIYMPPRRNKVKTIRNEEELGTNKEEEEESKEEVQASQDEEASAERIT